MLSGGSSGNHNFKFDENSSFLTIFSCPFGRHRYVGISIRAAPAGDMLQKKIDTLLSGITNPFGFADAILIVGFDEQGKDQSETLGKVLQICRQANLKLNKDKCPFRCGQSLLWQSDFMEGVSPNLREVQILIEMPSPKSKKELPSFLCRLNNRSKFPPMTAEVYQQVQKLTLVKAD